MWKIKTELIAIVQGLSVASKKEWKTISENVSGNMKIQIVQKSCLLGSSKILRKVQSI